MINVFEHKARNDVWVYILLSANNDKRYSHSIIIQQSILKIHKENVIYFIIIHCSLFTAEIRFFLWDSAIIYFKSMFKIKW